jgi:hypothetical protein
MQTATICKWCLTDQHKLLSDGDVERFFLIFFKKNHSFYKLYIIADPKGVYVDCRSVGDI